MLEQRIQQHFIDSADLKYQSAQSLSKPIAAAIQAMLACVTSGGKVLACGNGGSAADAQHFSAEFVGRFERERPELGAIALTTDSSILTAIANDYDFNRIFSRQVRALGQAGDVLLAITTSGNSANVLAAVEAAHEREMTVVALCGARAGALGQLLKDTDVLVCVPSERLPRIRAQIPRQRPRRQHPQQLKTNPARRGDRVRIKPAGLQDRPREQQPAGLQRRTVAAEPIAPKLLRRLAVQQPLRKRPRNLIVRGQIHEPA